MAPESDVVRKANVSIGVRTEADGKAGHLNTITTLDEPWRISHCMTAWCCLEFFQIMQRSSPLYEPFEALLVAADVTCSLQGTDRTAYQSTIDTFLACSQQARIAHAAKQKQTDIGAVSSSTPANLGTTPQPVWPDSCTCTQRMFSTNHQLSAGEHAGATVPGSPNPGASRHRQSTGGRTGSRYLRW